MWISREHIARATAVPAALAALALSCAAPRGAAPEATRTAALAPLLEAAREAAREAAPRPARALVVRLAFDAAADLDLYVTDPLAETVYFANTPVRSGGALDVDRGCDDPAPRLETVVFERPPPGRYRVGVDHPRTCPGHEGPAPFAVELEHEGGREAREGVVAPRRFELIVLEVELR